MKHEHGLLEHEQHEQKISRYTLNDFLPLITLFSLIALVTIFHQLVYGWNLKEGMRITMAAFFLIFGSFKIINLSGFAQAYSMYDLLAKRFLWYGYSYPFIEVGLGCAYLFSWQLSVVSGITVVLMTFSAAGVFNELRKGHTIICACLGAVFKIPMTYVTLIEDLLMAAMAFAMFVMK